MYQCDHCIFSKAENNKDVCMNCRDNPMVQKILAALPKQSYFAEYSPVCPRGYSDCVYDPAYIEFYYPEWYKELYKNLTPKEAIHVENGCWDCFQRDPDERCYCYDDEDK